MEQHNEDHEHEHEYATAIATQMKNRRSDSGGPVSRICRPTGTLLAARPEQRRDVEAEHGAVPAARLNVHEQQGDSRNTHRLSALSGRPPASDAR